MRRSGVRPAFTLTAGCLFALLAWSVPTSGQVMSPAGTDFHSCEDCHGSHETAPGRSGLVRPSSTGLSAQAPGIDRATERCLQCHGTEEDRRSAAPGGLSPGMQPILLGASLLDDHPLGSSRGDRGAVGTTGAVSPVDVLRLSTPGALEPGASVECDSCHDVHDPARVVEQSDFQDDMCLTCHDTTYDYNGHGIVSCGSCHKLHSAPERDFLTREPSTDYLCGACHEGAPLPLNAGMEPVLGAPLHEDPSDPVCQSCHRIH